MPNATRKYVPRENRLVYEYCKKFYPDKLQWRRVRVGPLPKIPEAKLYSVLRRYADIIVKDNKHILIVEAKMKPDPAGLMQLQLYERLFPQTPEFKEFWHLPIRKIFITTLLDKEVKKLAATMGIEYYVFSPKWVKVYWKERIAQGR